MWQFIPSTGRRYGLRAEGDLDERCDWRKATVAAAGYFEFLLNEFDGYPFLALAAYNAGERRVGKVLKNPNVPKHLANFYGFTAAGVLPDETRNYVPSIVASAFVGDNYSKALAAWNAAYPNKKIKAWAPCSPEESRPPPSVPCPNGPAGCPRRR
jgi:membrane-bound lytic murein transglycosylase D